jgi:D-amino-acid dehydrogenase
MAEVAVIGAGAVGVACALACQEAGLATLLIDPAPVAASEAAASFGNAGGITVSAVVPMATPATLRAVPRMLRDPLAPLSVRWRDLPALAPWLARFALNARPRRLAQVHAALCALFAESGDAWRRLAQRVPCVSSHLHWDGILYAYRSEAALRGAAPAHAMRRAAGFGVRELDGAGVAARVPGLAPMRGGVLIPECGHLDDPAAVVRLMEARFRALGGARRVARVRGMAAAGEGVAIHLDDGTRLAAPQAVLAAGIRGGALARGAGLRLPLAAERGYHAMLPEPGITLPLQLMDGDGSYALTSMREGLRLAGTVELAAPDAPPDWRRAHILVEQARRLLPGLNAEGARVWMGCRPSLPDGLPAIGRAPRLPALVCALGHGHNGLTLAALTGEVVARLLRQRDPGLDLAPLDPARFA